MTQWLSQAPWLGLALALGAAAITVAVYELVCVRPLRRRAARADAQLAVLAQSAEAASRLAAQAGRVQRLEGQTRQLAERLGQLELRADTRGYEQAIQLAAHGGGTDRLVSCFGLTEGEAELVSLLHGR